MGMSDGNFNEKNLENWTDPCPGVCSGPGIESPTPVVCMCGSA